MSLAALVILAVALAMDATAVSAARGLIATSIGWREVGKVALLFGGFQALMPLIGWSLGSAFGRYVDAWDHWIAFGLLAGIGVHMILEARGDHTPEERTHDPFGWRVMLLLALATSIDALGAGVSLAMLDAPPLAAAAVIGIITALLSAGGLFAGRRFGAALGRRLEVAGGLVLIVLGVKTLF